MGILDIFRSKKEKQQLDEALKSFEKKGDSAVSDKFLGDRSGEGLEEIGPITGYGSVSLSSFNLFYQTYINKEFQNEIQKIKEYRGMADMPEIGDVIEDAVNEMTQEDDDGQVIRLEITDAELEKNTNIVNNLTDEFYELFYDKIDIEEHLWNLIRTYFIDGRVYYERIVNSKKPSEGIIGIKRLPSETMDFDYDIRTGKIRAFFQYLTPMGKKPKSFEEADKDPNVITFYPEQIGYINSGIYGKTRHDVMGYLEKSKVPYSQLKLLETSIIIYRIVRAPERFVFRIDTGNMPRDKAMKFVEKIKQKMTKKQTYDPSTGRLSNEPEIMSLLENFYLPQCIRLNTEISLTDGNILSLSNIIKEYNDGIKNNVYTINTESGIIEENEIEWAGITRKNAELMRITLENDEYLDVTPDHKFLVWEDETRMEMIEVEAQYLTEEMELVDNENMLG